MPNTGHVRSAQQTKGSVALKKCGESDEQRARRIGASIHTIRNWLRGHRRPGPAWRDSLLKHYGIPVDDWDKPIEFEPAGSPLLEALAAATPVPPAPELAVDNYDANAPPAQVARDFISQVQRIRRGVEVDPTLSVDERAKALGRAAQILALVYRLTGEASDISEAKILRSPAWQKIQLALLEAVTPWPEAVRAIGEALAGLDS